MMLLGILNVCNGEGTIKTINMPSAIEKIVGFMYDFYLENLRYPESLNDLIENKPKKFDYNTLSILKRYEDLGYKITYSFNEHQNKFEVSLASGNKQYFYKSEHDMFYFYEDNVLIQEYDTGRKRD